jgi:hypothetical protein
MEDMKNIDYNQKYKFVSKKNEWFDDGTVCACCGLWFDCYPQSLCTEEISFDILISDKQYISGIFRGFHEGHLDEEVCGLEEFEIVKI